MTAEDGMNPVTRRTLAAVRANRMMFEATELAAAVLGLVVEIIPLESRDDETWGSGSMSALVPGLPNCISLSVTRRDDDTLAASLMAPCRDDPPTSSTRYTVVEEIEELPLEGEAHAQVLRRFAEVLRESVAYAEANKGTLDSMEEEDAERVGILTSLRERVWDSLMGVKDRNDFDRAVAAVQAVLPPLEGGSQA